MKFASYNIQYGIGLDGRFDLDRIAEALSGADVIALQEVTRNFARNDNADLPKSLASLFPDYYHAFGAGMIVDGGSGMVDGHIVMRHLEFGNMILSRFPILSIRNLLLPRSRTYDRLNLQRSALEALIETPQGPLRVYSVHLDHRSADERIVQIDYLRARATGFGLEGGALTGAPEFGLADLPECPDYLLMGDFNMMPEQPEYCAMTGRTDLYYGRTARATHPVDTLLHLGSRMESDFTWQYPDDLETRQYLDYIFASATLIPKLRSGWVDLDAVGSDHKPVWLELADG